MFIWDTNKALSNFEKHGVSFEEAATAFADSDSLEWQDLEHSQKEIRWKRIGMSLSERILLIVFTLRKGSHGKETIRIISARQASRKERKAYTGL